MRLYSCALMCKMMCVCVFVHMCMSMPMPKYFYIRCVRTSMCTVLRRCLSISKQPYRCYVHSCTYTSTSMLLHLYHICTCIGVSMSGNQFAN